MNNRLNIAFRVLLFFLTSAILVYLFPREGKFRYEFQKGKPWMHEALDAPFDFPIYKTKQELAIDRDSILKDFHPYFSIDSTIKERQLNLLRKEFDGKWKTLDFARIAGQGHKLIPRTGAGMDSGRIIHVLCSVLSEIYDKGILPDEGMPKEAANTNEIEVLHNNYAVLVKRSEVFTAKFAYQNLVKQATASLKGGDSITADAIEPILANLDLNVYLESNLTFEKFKTKQARETMLDGISTAKGMKREGERIVFNGELVNDSTFQILESLKTEYETKLGSSSKFYLVILGQSILVMISVLVVFLFLSSFRKEVYHNRIKTIFILMLIVIMAFTTRMTIEYSIFSIYLLPFAIIPVIVKTFYDSRLALFIHMITILIIGFWVPNSFEFVFITFVAGIVAIFTLSNLYRRGKLFLSAVLVVVAYIITYFGISIIQEGNIHTIDYKNLIWFSGNGLLVLTSYPLIFIFEKVFGFLSDATLIELSDTNQPLLRKLAEMAPGTFQHSLQVANLAEEAIFRIGGNPLLIRTGALYHDIGKVDNPMYFVENQGGGVNFHDSMEYEESAVLVIGHVQKGVEIAKKHNIPEQIIDFIVTHHGTTTAQYFYKSHLLKNPGSMVDISHFQYPGPVPHTKECTVLMMADAIEAASRSLKKVNEKNLNELVDNIINHQLLDEQYSEANITFREIRQVKEIFKSRLKNIYHVRIQYPA